tara:strand:- start:1012 stop:1251 length:240 start_codon:yes stop_codon:yes gene_type:complete
MFFFLKYHGGWSFAEAYNLPVGLRHWFAKRLMKQLKDEGDQMKSARSGGSGPTSQTLTQHNNPGIPSAPAAKSKAHNRR